MRRVRRAASAVVALALAAYAPAARAAEAGSPLRVLLSERVPAACGRSKPLSERVAARTDRLRIVTDEPAEVRVRSEVTPEAGRFRGRLAVEEHGEFVERSVAGASCDEVLAAFAVMVVVALDAERDASSAAPSAGEAASTPPPLASVVALGPATATVSGPPRARHRSPFALGLGVGFGLPFYDGILFEPSMNVELRWRAPLAPRLRATLARTAHDSVETRTDRVDLVWTTGRASICGAPAVTFRRGLSFCAWAKAGELRATVVRPGGTSRGLVWASAGPSALLDIELGHRLALQLEGGVGFPILSDRFYFEPATLAYQAPTAYPFVAVNLLSHVLPLLR